MKKIILIISIVMAFSLLSSCENKSVSIREVAQDELQNLSSQLYELSLHAKDALDYDNLEDMRGAMENIYEECKRLNIEAETASHLFHRDDP